MMKARDAFAAANICIKSPLNVMNMSDPVSVYILVGWPKLP